MRYEFVLLMVLPPPIHLEDGASRFATLAGRYTATTSVQDERQRVAGA